MTLAQRDIASAEHAPPGGEEAVVAGASHHDAAPAGEGEQVISVEGIGKMYRLYKRPQDRLKALLFSRFGKSYGKKFWALRGVDLHVGRGEAVGIVGRNGSGKSTLLQIIAGTLRPTTGSVVTRGRIAALLELGSGFNPEYTGRENVYMNASILGMTPEQVNQRLDGILSFADIGHFVDQPVKTYSSGMFVRLAFAVAVNVEPDVLIVDEALSVGDLNFQSKCFRKIREFRERGVSILLCTHDMSALTRFCDRAIVLERGRVQGSGTAKAMVDLYKQVVTPNEMREGSREEEPTLGESVRAALTGIAPAPRAAPLKSLHKLSPNLQEYGGRDMEIVDFGLTDEKGRPANVVVGGEAITVTISAVVRRPVKHPILAFSIKDMRGTEICGTNTLYQEEDLGVRREGETVTVRWRMPLDLCKGSYTLSLGCTEFVEEGLAVHHRLYDAILFEAQPFEKFVGFYNPRPEISVVRGGR